MTHGQMMANPAGLLYLQTRLYWNHAKPTHSQTVYGRFHATTAAWRTWAKRPPGLQSLKYLRFGPYRRKFANPYIRQMPFYLPPGTSQKDKNFNLPRLCIRKFFPKKKCFIFDRPTQRKKLGQLEDLGDDELDSEFVQQAAEFCSYIFLNSKTKTLSGGIKVTGPRECSFLSYPRLRVKDSAAMSTWFQF